MTPERLAEMRSMAVHGFVPNDVLDLLSEVERLTAELAEMDRRRQEAFDAYSHVIGVTLFGESAASGGSRPTGN